jgi:hypothetical protein
MILFIRVSGILVIGAGVLAIGFGIPINEFNLGNTLIVSGTIAFAAGLILIGVAAAVDQLTQIAEALRPRAGARPGAQPQAAEALPAAARLGPVPGPVSGPAGPLPAKVPMPPPSRAPVFAKPRPDEFVPDPAVAESASEVSPSAIERLRSSMGRPDLRAGESPADAEDVSYSAPAVPAGPRPGTNQGTNGAAPTGGAGEARKKPPLDFLFRSKAREPQPEAFDAVWPKRGPRHGDEQADADESVAAEAPVERPYPSSNPPASVNDEVRPAAILKSGVVDGMAYTLYADGSIEAQLPQGTVRFGSIAELRSHIENNS